MRRRSWLTFAVTGCACTGAPAREAEPLTARVAFSDLEPWMTHQGGEYVGSYIEILRELARRGGLRLVFQDCPQRRCLRQLEAGEADLTIGLRRTPEREAYLHFLNTPYRRTSSDKLFYVRQGEAGRVQRYQDLLDLRVGVKSGALYFEPFDSDPRVRKDVAPQNANNFKKLLLGRVDAVAMAQDQGEFLRENLGLRERIEPAQFRVPDPTPRFIAISRRSPRMKRLPELEAAMQALQRDGSLGPVHTTARGRVAPCKGRRQGATRSRGGPPTRSCNAACGPCRRQPEGKALPTGPLVVATLARTLVRAAARASIGPAGRAFATPCRRVNRPTRIYEQHYYQRYRLSLRDVRIE